MRTINPVLLVALVACTVHAVAADVQPTNDLPNPYQTTAPWGKVTDRKWGALNGVAIDNDGTSVWVVDRCGASRG